MDSLESNKAAGEPIPQATEIENSRTEVNVSSAHTGSEQLPSAQAEETQADAEGQPKQVYRRRHKLYQALARVEGALKVKGDELVIITKGDKAEFQVAQIGGNNTAMRLLKRAANRRQGFYTLYPHSAEQSQLVKLTNFHVEADEQHPDVPPVDQMFISGKLDSKEEDAFLVNIGRNKRTRKAKKKIRMPLRISGKEADPDWKLGRWLGLVLHRQGTDWIWTGETRPVLKSGRKQAEQESEADSSDSSSSAADQT